MKQTAKMEHPDWATRVCFALNVLAFAVLGACLITSCSSIKNMQLTEACHEALATNPNIDASKITCNVKDGVAYVSGNVYTEEQRKLVVEILEGVEGITDVRETITIEEGGETNPVMLFP